MRCKKCNHFININEKFCPNCGKKIGFLILAIVLIIICLLVFFSLFSKNKKKKAYDLVGTSTSISYSYSDDHILKSIDGRFSKQLIHSSSDVLTALESIKDKIGFKDATKEFVLLSEETSEGITYYKYNQVYKGTPVLYQNIIVSVDQNKNILGYSGYYIPNIQVDVVPKKSAEEIEKNIKKHLGKNSNIVSNTLSIWADIKQYTLVYNILGYSDSKAVICIVDANTGEILSEESVFEAGTTYSYTGMGMDNKTYKISLEKHFDVIGMKNRYRFYDRERKISIVDSRKLGYIDAQLLPTLLLPNYESRINSMVVDIVDNQIDTTLHGESFVQNAITTMANYEKIYDYYKNVLGRDSYDNKGSKIIVNLGVTESTGSSKDLNNAFWSRLTNQMYIGNWKGKSLSASLDILAHEFTHGVISKTANFALQAKKADKNKAFETGALSEGYADVLGSLVEGKNWTIAEDNEIVRSASNPEAYENPSVKGGKYYYPDGYLTDGRTLKQLLKEHDLEFVVDFDNGGVHQNANVVSHAAYLMYKNGAFQNRKEMAKVWYNSLFSLSSYSNFEDCALAVMKTAKNLGLNEASLYQITKAFQDTKMLQNKYVPIHGSVKSGDEKLKKVQVKVYSYKDGSEIKTLLTNESGEYKLELPMGTYRIEFKLQGFETYETVVVVQGDTTLDVVLAYQIEEGNMLKNACKTEKCHNFTIYFLESDAQNKLKEIHETYSVDSGTTVDANVIVDSVNHIFGNKFLTMEGQSFYMTVGDFKVEYAWYYKDTDTKFDWNKPIDQDIEIEMKLMNGLLDNDTFIHISDWFK